MNAPPPEHCPGVDSDAAGKSSTCAGCPNQKLCSSGEAKQAVQLEMESVIPLIVDRLKKIKHIILVISGKGGTGKSTISSMLARSLALDANKQVGLLDLDICGPSAPRMFGVENEQVHQSSLGWTPVYVSDNLALMSCGFLLGSLDDAIIWRGPKKNTLIKQLLIDVDWGELDYLIVDTPPGTSDEHISLLQYLKQTNLANLDGALMVTTPQEVSLMDVRKQVDFCKRTSLRILGLVENMGEFECPKCGRGSTIFPSDSGGATKLASDFGLELLARFALNPLIGQFCDAGQSIWDECEADAGDSRHTYLSGIAQSFLQLRDKLLNRVK